MKKWIVLGQVSLSLDSFILFHISGYPAVSGVFLLYGSQVIVKWKKNHQVLIYQKTSYWICFDLTAVYDWEEKSVSHFLCSESTCHPYWLPGTGFQLVLELFSRFYCLFFKFLHGLIRHNLHDHFTLVWDAWGLLSTCSRCPDEIEIRS